MKPSLLVAAAQMTSVDSWEKNLESISRLAKEACREEDTDIVFFPENSLYMRLDPNDEFPGFNLEHQSFADLKSLANQLGCAIVLGSVLTRAKLKPFNSTVVIEPDQSPRLLYNKIHLFDVQVDADHKIQESKNCQHGSEPAIWEYEGWKFGLSICYDLRFSELYSQYARSKVDVICVPSAFTVPTGRAHWEILLRARAIESQVYLVAPAQWGGHVGKSGVQRETYGHSLLIGPWGEKLGELGEGEGVIRSTLLREKITRVRQQIPMEQHRRLTL